MQLCHEAWIIFLPRKILLQSSGVLSCINPLIKASYLLFLTSPFGEIDNALPPFAEHLDKKTFFDATNPITPDHRELTIGYSHSGAEKVSHCAMAGAS